MQRTLTAAALAAFWLTAAQADPFTDAVVTRYQEMGFNFIEVQNGQTQVKVEAIRGTEKLEVIYDRATGRILKQEQERAEIEEQNRTGVQVRERSRDFVRAMAGGAGVSLSGATETAISDLRSQGYEFFEIKNGPTQTKIEAVRGGEKLELIIDSETGAILKREFEDAGSDAGRSGLKIDDRDSDFLDDDDDDDDRSGHGSGSDDDEDDDDNSGPGGGDDDDDDDDEDDDNSGSGSHD